MERALWHAFSKQNDARSTIKMKITLFPNPATDYVTWDLGSQKVDILQVEVFNDFGQRLWFKQLPPDDAYRLDVSHWSPGNYLFRFKAGHQSYSEILVIPHR
jgi:hypothetical protein